MSPVRQSPPIGTDNLPTGGKLPSMSRRLNQPYRCEPLRDLARQLAFAPPNRRVEQVRRAERLHDEIDPQRTYPLEFLVFRLTGYRPDTGSDGSLLLVGEAIRPDLRLIIDQLSRSTDIPPDDEPYETADQLAQRLRVSTRTVARWRRAGLRWRWMPQPHTDRRQIVIPRSAIDHFQASHADRIERASSFTHLDPAARQAIIQRARRLAEARDVSFNQVADHLAKRTGRALETIRLILDKHDRAHPDEPIFTDRTGPLTPRQRRVIARAHRMGIPVRQLSRRFNRTRATIYRTIHQQRAAHARRLVIDYIHLPIFDRDDADAVILRPSAGRLTAEPRGASTAAHLDDLPAALQPAFAHAPLPAAKVRSLFVRYNYLKYKACRIRDGLHRHEPRGSELDAFDRCVTEARLVRATLLNAHRPLLLSVVRRHLISESQPTSTRLLELLDVGHDVLSEAVDAFNSARNATFTSYLTNRLLRRLAADPDNTPRTARRRRSLPDLTAQLHDCLNAKNTWPLLTVPRTPRTPAPSRGARPAVGGGAGADLFYP